MEMVSIGIVNSRDRAQRAEGKGPERNLQQEGGACAVGSRLVGGDRQTEGMAMTECHRWSLGKARERGRERERQDKEKRGKETHRDTLHGLTTTKDWYYWPCSSQETPQYGVAPLSRRAGRTRAN